MGVSQNSPKDSIPAVTNYPLCATYSGAASAGEMLDIACSDIIVGRHVIIQIPGTSEILTLCEVEVFGPGELFVVFCHLCNLQQTSKWEHFILSFIQ